MRGFTFAFSSLLLVGLISNFVEAEYCHPGACIEAGKCVASRSNFECPDEGEVCCNEVREEDKHHCRHFLGECMDNCNSVQLTKKADDCPKGTTCCVLVN